MCLVRGHFYSKTSISAAYNYVNRVDHVNPRNKRTSCLLYNIIIVPKPITNVYSIPCPVELGIIRSLYVCMNRILTWYYNK